MLKLLRFIREDLWSPYAAGILLGVVVVLSMWIGEHTVGASGGFQSLAAYVGLELTSEQVEVAAEPAPAAAEATGDDADFWGSDAAESASDDAGFWGSESETAESASDDADFWGSESKTTEATSDDAGFGGAEADDAATNIEPEMVTVARSGSERQFTFFAFTSPKGVSWMVWLLAGIFLGSLTSSLLSGGFKLSLMPHSEQWVAVFGPQVWKRWTLVFAGSVLIAIAAGIAGGCTSGLAIAKGVQLHPAAFLFIMGMFTSGPVVAALVYGRRY